VPSPRPRMALGAETPPRQSPVAPAARGALAAPGSSETPLPGPSHSASRPRRGEGGDVSSPQRAQRAERESSDSRGPQGSPLLGSAREVPATGDPRRSAWSAPARPTPARAARPKLDASSPSSVQRVEASLPRSREMAGWPVLRADARVGRVEVTEIGPRLRLRMPPAPTVADPGAFDPSGAQPTRSAAGRASLRPSERARAEPSRGTDGIMASRAPSARASATARRGVLAQSPSAATAPPSDTNRIDVGETARSLRATDRSRRLEDASWGALGAPLAPMPARRRDGVHPPQRFPELPPRDGGAAAARATRDDWPELPPRPTDVASALPDERCDQLLREQSEV
jgi:hypothetical protein